MTDKKTFLNLESQKYLAALKYYSVINVKAVRHKPTLHCVLYKNIHKQPWSKILIGLKTTEENYNFNDVSFSSPTEAELKITGRSGARTDFIDKTSSETVTTYNGIPIKEPTKRIFNTAKNQLVLYVLYDF